MAVSAINKKLDERFNFLGPLDEEHLTSLITRPKLSSIAREIVQLLVNHQLIPFSICPKSISLEQSCNEKPPTIVVTSILFSTLKKKDLNLIWKIATNIVLALKLFWI